MTTSTPPSPLTGSSHTKLLATLDVASLSRRWKSEYGMDVASEFHGHTQVQYLECLDTGLRFFRPTDIAGSGPFYAQLMRFDWYYLPDKWEHKAAMASIRHGERVLEVGCGAGAFIARARSAGIDIVGLEINAAAVAEATARGLPVHEMSLDQAAARFGAGFDVVCAFQVLEHVPEPREFLDGMARLLRPGGRLLLSVPDQEGYGGRDPGLLDGPPHHMSQWSRRVFESLARFMPLRLALARPEPLAPYHIRAYLIAMTHPWVTRAPVLRLVFNRVTFALMGLVLRMGFYRQLRGHSIYVELVKESQPVAQQSASSSTSS